MGHFCLQFTLKQLYVYVARYIERMIKGKASMVICSYLRNLGGWSSEYFVLLLQVFYKSVIT